MTDPANQNQIRVILATPSREGPPTHDFGVSLTNTKAVLNADGIGFAFLSLSKISDLCGARNRLAETFLLTNGTHLLMIDDDIGWQPQSVLQMLKHDVDYVAGPYLRKDDTPSPRWALALPVPICVRDDGLVKADGVGLGFTLVKREVIERLCAAHRDESYIDSDTGRETVNLFEFKVIDRQRKSEDFMFGHKWRALGGDIWVDTKVVLDHIGRKTWTASLAERLQQEQEAANNMAAAAE